MRCAYDLSNPKERKMYMEKRKRDFERAMDTEKTIWEKQVEIMQERQKEIEFFMQSDREKAEMEKQLHEEIEKQLPKVVEKTLGELLKGF